MLSPETKANFFKVTSSNSDALKKPELRAIGFDFAPMAEKIDEIAGDLEDIESHENALRMSPAAESALGNIAGNLFSQVIERIRNFAVKDNANASGQYRDIGTALAGIYYEFITVAEPFLVRIALAGRPATATGASSEDLFAFQADMHARHARGWFAALAGSIGAFAYALPKLFSGQWPFDYLGAENTGTAFGLVQVLAFKLVILLLIGFAIQQSAKNCRIHSHLNVANRHRHNTLAIFPKIAARAGDSGTRHIITAQAARAAFEPVPTGYFKNRNDSVSGLPDIKSR